MTLTRIAVSNLRRRKAKAFFILAGLVIGVATAVTLISLAAAMKGEINHKLELYGANILVLPRTENLPLSYGGLSLGGVSFELRQIRQDELRRINEIPNRANVAAVGPMVLGGVEVNGKRLLLAGVDFAALRILRPWWSMRGEEPGEGEALLGAEAARILGLGQGDVFAVNDRRLRVSALLEQSGSQDDGLIFVSLDQAQAILGKQGEVSLAEVAALCTGCPIPEMVRQIAAVLPGANVTAIQQVVKGRMEVIGHFERFSLGISILVLFVGGLICLVTMMGSVRERTVEIGIFSAMGFRASHVMRIILTEAALVAALAGVLGYGLGYGAARLILPVFSQGHGTHLPFEPLFAAAALFVSLGVGLTASVYPAYRASRLDPSEALRTL